MTSFFSTKAKQINWLSIFDGSVPGRWSALFPFVFCLLIGFLISYSTPLALLAVAAPLAAIIFLKPEIGLYLMIAFIPLESISALAKSFTLIKLLGWVVLAGWALKVALTQKPIIFPSVGRYLIGFVLWGLVSFFWAVDPKNVLSQLLTSIQLVGFYMMVINLVDSIEKVSRVFSALLVGSLIASLVVSLIYFSGMSVGAIFSGQVAWGGRASIGDPNEFSSGLLLIIPFLFLSIIFSTTNLSRFCFLGAAAIVMITFFLGMSRTAIAALGMVMMAMVIKYRRRISRLIVFIPIVIFLSLYFMPEQFWQRMLTGFTLKDRGSRRFDIWLVGWEIIKNHPLLGVGRDNFRVAFDDYRTMTTLWEINCRSCFVPHNIYLEVVSELGILGGVLFLMVIISYIKSGYKTIKFYEERDDRRGEMITASALLSFLGLLVVGSGIGILTVKYFWITMALIEVMSLLVSDTYFTPVGGDGGTRSVIFPTGYAPISTPPNPVPLPGLVDCK